MTNRQKFIETFGYVAWWFVTGTNVTSGERLYIAFDESWLNQPYIKPEKANYPMEDDQGGIMKIIVNITDIIALAIIVICVIVIGIMFLSDKIKRWRKKSDDR